MSVCEHIYIYIIPYKIFEMTATKELSLLIRRIFPVISAILRRFLPLCIVFGPITKAYSWIVNLNCGRERERAFEIYMQRTYKVVYLVVSLIRNIGHMRKYNWIRFISWDMKKKQLKKHDNNNFLMKNMHICRYSQVEGGRWCNVAYLPYMHPIITCKKGGGGRKYNTFFDAFRSIFVEAYH